MLAPDKTEARFTLVKAGHQFLLSVLPFRGPESRDALATFVTTAKQSNASGADVELVLLRCLKVIGSHTARRIPSLLEQFISDASSGPDVLTRFSQVVEGLLRYHCVSDRSVQEVLQFIDNRRANPECNPRLIAERLRQRLSTLDAEFKRQVGTTISDYIREVRLARAAVLLAISNCSIKEVWVQVGYSHHSNFDHDFRRKFKSTPSEYRARVIRPAARQFYAEARVEQLPFADAKETAPPLKVLIVDDDDSSRLILSALMRQEGWSPSVAVCGSEGLAAADRISPDAIVLDYRLGDIDGMQFLRILRRSCPGRDPNVILFTADWDIYDHADEARLLNAVIASKLDDIHHVIELIADRGRAVSATHETT